MRTLYLRNVPDEVARALEELARRESMSVSSLAVRELKAAVAFRANAEVLHEAPRRELDLEDIVQAVRSGRDT
ncbi:antitoxin [Nostocoides sp. F2B08]|uniref:antitoxin n=1 Tax=Nostocoides sp. F2B08 TaxID=2653936 RepID=UPI0012631828|nr:antitoxin [Tetrasphaera sp. F2B08]KAB7745409.1 antitoxin [Tetrasphaera sp. F2B08]